MSLFQNKHCNHHIYQNLFHFLQDYVVEHEAYFQMKLPVLSFHTKYIVLFLYIS